MQQNKKNEKFALFDFMSIEKKFDSDSKSSFRATEVPTVKHKSEISSQDAKIEFETKASIGRTTPSDVNPEVDVAEIQQTINSSNVYLKVGFPKNGVFVDRCYFNTPFLLKERPDIDIFKAIFDDDNATEEQENETNVTDANEEEIVLSSDEDVPQSPAESPYPLAIEKIPSSLSGIDMKKLSHYLKDADRDESKNRNLDFFDKPECDQVKEYGPSKPIVFTAESKPVVKLSKLIKNVASSMKHRRKTSSSSADSDESGEYEFVEKTGDNAKEKKKSAKNKKQKKSKKKKKKK
jgi:hypothetical protein